MNQNSRICLEKLARRIKSGNQKIGYDGVREITLCDNQFASKTKDEYNIRNVASFWSKFIVVSLIALVCFYSMYSVCTQ